MLPSFDAAIIYIDESGDLGFHADRNGSSEYLIITALACRNREASQAIMHAVKRVRNHENKRSKKTNLSELKGSKTKFDLKRYFFKQLNTITGWQLFTISANKQFWNSSNMGKLRPENFYDQTLIQLLQSIPLEQSATLVIDRSKTQEKIDDLNLMIEKTFASTTIKLTINHHHSYAHAGLQAVDIFSWGIARKYEHNDTQWYDVFKERIALELQA